MSHRNGDGNGTIAGRSVPHNIEAEMSLIGACLLDNRMIDECVTIMGSEDLYRDAHIEIWSAMVSIRDMGYPVDAVSLADHLIHAGRFEVNGGDAYIRDLVDSVPHAANARFYAGVVRESSIIRHLIQATSEILGECYANQMTAPELIAAAEARIFAIAEREVGGGAVGMDELIGEAMARIRRRQAGEVDDIATGFEDLDDVLLGLERGSFTILAARPSIGKTSLGMAIASNIGAAEGKPVLFMSLEMNRRELASRYLSAWAEINARDFKVAGRLGEAGWRQLCNAAGRLTKLPTMVDDTPGRTVSQIAALARRTARSGGLGGVMVDYVGLIDGRRQRGESRQEEVGKISGGLKRLARELDVPLIGLHQLNRRPESRDDRRPQMADLRDSGALEQDADVVLLLHRPEFYDPAEKPGVAEIIIAKNRNGPTGAVELAFRKEWARFDSLSRTTAENGPVF